MNQNQEGEKVGAGGAEIVGGGVEDGTNAGRWTDEEHNKFLEAL